MLLFPQQVENLMGLCLVSAIPPLEPFQDTWPLYQSWTIHSPSAT